MEHVYTVPEAAGFMLSHLDAVQHKCSFLYTGLYVLPLSAHTPVIGLDLSQCHRYGQRCFIVFVTRDTSNPSSDKSAKPPLEILKPQSVRIG